MKTLIQLTLGLTMTLAILTGGSELFPKYTRFGLEHSLNVKKETTSLNSFNLSQNRGEGAYDPTVASISLGKSNVENQKLTLDYFENQFHSLSDNELEQNLSRVDQEIAEGKYIEKANSNTLSQQEQVSFKILLRKSNALNWIKSDRML